MSISAILTAARLAKLAQAQAPNPLPTWDEALAGGGARPMQPTGGVGGVVPQDYNARAEQALTASETAQREASGMTPPEYKSPQMGGKELAILLGAAAIAKLFKAKDSDLAAGYEGFQGTRNQMAQEDFANRRSAYEAKRGGLLQEANIQGERVGFYSKLADREDRQAEARRIAGEMATTKSVAESNKVARTNYLRPAKEGSMETTAREAFSLWPDDDPYKPDVVQAERHFTALRERDKIFNDNTTAKTKGLTAAALDRESKANERNKLLPGKIRKDAWQSELFRVRAKWYPKEAQGKLNDLASRAIERTGKLQIAQQNANTNRMRATEALRHNKITEAQGWLTKMDNDYESARLALKDEAAAIDLDLRTLESQYKATEKKWQDATPDSNTEKELRADMDELEADMKALTQKRYEIAGQVKQTYKDGEAARASLRSAAPTSDPLGIR